MKTVNIFKAQSSGDAPVEDVTIVINATLPELPDGMPTPEFLLQSHDRFQEEAGLLFWALEVLPGGTWDRLLGLMLAKKASHFVVAHGPMPSISKVKD